MDALIKKSWHALASVRLTLVCMTCLCVCAGIGYFLIRSQVHVFKPLQDLSLISWAKTWGLAHLSVTWWFFLLLGLLALLCLNTFVCTTDRVNAIWRNRKRFPGRTSLVLRLSPHIMHYALIMILAGYLTSYVFANTVTSLILLPDRPTRVENTSITITLTDLQTQTYHGKRMGPFDGRAIKAAASLFFEDSKGRTKTAQAGVNRPVRFQGLSVHMTEFAPRSEGGMVRRKYAGLTVRQDPGIPIYYAGMALFVLGLIFYVFSITPWGERHMRGSYA
ncbi:conserved hypothetical protein [Desulfatibacillum aliphaticivorans]|uniref:ResB-like domain-containing protein n=1 Tax=Desulfatibacillum aliphaticivorans TaxID=218208 RepID=B8FM07_DESAL|nr:cytochrome c biogenesis protein ResB [Desulfatibacillum aliphaticivorans]ACL05740.1 conserved hypothetical protein [Desulfatibacillum aliphaticivorans]